MSTAPQNLGWPTSRLAFAIFFVTAFQAFVVLRFAQVPAIPLLARPPMAATTLLWDPAQVEAAFAGVPANRRDLLERDPSDAFQSIARRSVPKAEYRLAEFRDPARWLTNPPALDVVGTPAPIPLPIPSPSTPERLGVTVPDATPSSTVVVTGGTLARRPWLKPPVLGPWQGTETPGTTRLEVAVNPQGWIVLLRVSESSGSREADDIACRAIRESLLSPAPGAAKRPAFSTQSLEWGTFTVEWASPSRQP